jgi:putative sterol carrier protein
MELLGQALRQDASRTDGINAIFGFDVSGAGGGSWWIEASDGVGAVHAGVPPKADVIIRLTEDVLLRLARSELDGGEAFAQGLIRVEKDQSKAIFLGQIFGV